MLHIFLGNSWKHLGNFLPQQLVTLVLTANSDGEKINIIMSRAKAMAFGTPFLSLSQPFFSKVQLLFQAQLAESKIRGSNPVIGNILWNDYLVLAE